MIAVILANAACATVSNADLGYRRQEPTEVWLESECGERDLTEIEALRGSVDGRLTLPPRGADICEVWSYLGVPLSIEVVRNSPWPVQLTYGYFDGIASLVSDTRFVFTNPRPTLRVLMTIDPIKQRAAGRQLVPEFDCIVWMDGPGPPEANACESG